MSGDGGRPRFSSPSDDPYAPPTPPSETDRRIIRALSLVVVAVVAGCLIAWQVTGKTEFMGGPLVTALIAWSLINHVERLRGHRTFWWNLRVAWLGDRPAPLRFSKRAHQDEASRRALVARESSLATWVAAGAPPAGAAQTRPAAPAAARTGEFTAVELRLIQELVGGTLLAHFPSVEGPARRERKAMRADLERRGLIESVSYSCAVGPQWVDVLGVVLHTTRLLRLTPGPADRSDHVHYAVAGERAVRYEEIAAERYRLTALPTAGVLEELGAAFTALRPRSAGGDDAALVIDRLGADGSSTTFACSVEAVAPERFALVDWAAGGVRGDALSSGALIDRLAIKLAP